MQIITKRERIIEAKAHWLQQYSREPTVRVTGWNAGITFGEIRGRLAQLDAETCSERELNEALGMAERGTWGHNECDECGENVDVLIRIGEEPEYEARWLDLCANCLSKAAETLAASSAPAPAPTPTAAPPRADGRPTNDCRPGE